MSERVSTTDRKRVALLIAVMSAVSLVVAALTIYVLYQTAFREEQARLMETCHSQARLIEAIARFCREKEPMKWEAATLNQIVDAHGRYTGSAETGEFVLARHSGDRIVFLSHRRSQLEQEVVRPFLGRGWGCGLTDAAGAGRPVGNSRWT